MGIDSKSDLIRSLSIHQESSLAFYSLPSELKHIFKCRWGDYEVPFRMSDNSFSDSVYPIFFLLVQEKH